MTKASSTGRRNVSPISRSADCIRPYTLKGRGANGSRGGRERGRPLSSRRFGHLLRKDIGVTMSTLRRPAIRAGPATMPPSSPRSTRCCLGSRAQKSRRRIGRRAISAYGMCTSGGPAFTDPLQWRPPGTQRRTGRKPNWPPAMSRTSLGFALLGLDPQGTAYIFMSQHTITSLQ